MTGLVRRTLCRDPWGVTDRETPDGPPYFGMPEDGPFTMEGRIERAGAVADHANRVGDGRERPLRETGWVPGLQEVGLVLGLLVVVFVVLYFVG